MKNDLKLKISELRQVESGIETVRNALAEIAEASDRFQTVLKEQDSQAYEELSGLWEEKVKEEEGDLSHKLGCLAGMVDNYIEAVTACVSPEDESVMMRVDRYDIWWNYNQIAGKAPDFWEILGDTASSWADYKKIYIYSPFQSPEENEARKAELAAEERAERERRERNYKKLEEFRTAVRNKMTGELMEYVEKIHRIYEDSVVPFEKADDYYQKQLAEEYDEWATFWNKAEDVGDVTVDVFSGLWDAAKDMLTGLWGLVKGAAKLSAWLELKRQGAAVPESLEEDVAKIFQGAEAIITDPGNVLEAIGQNIFDKADEEGLAYSVGYVGADIAVTILLDKGVGKLKELRRAKSLNVADDVLNVADDVLNVSDDVANAADDVLNVTDDILNATDDALDAVDDLTGVGNNGTSVIDDVVGGGSDSKIRPSNTYDVDAKPSGTSTRITDKMDDATRRSLIRENEAAETIARNGYSIEQNPIVEGTTRNPDYRIEGEIFDCYSPAENTKIRNIASTIEEKVIEKGQANRVVLNLEDWNGNINELINQLNEYPIEGLEEVLVVKDGKVISIYP